MKALTGNTLWKMQSFWFGLVVSLTLAACAGAPAPTPAPTQPPPTPGAPGIPHRHIPFLPSGTWQTDVTYCQDGDVALKMDVLYPDATTGAAAPVAVFLHALDGDKNQVDIDATGELLKRGYVVVAPTWRRPPDFKLPVGIADAKCVVRHLRANAAIYGIDPKRIGAFGCATGGYMAALLGLTNADAGLEGSGGFADQSSRVTAVVSRDRIAFTDVNYWGPGEVEGMFGISSLTDPVLAKTSPLTYVSKDSPPFLLFQTAQDDTRSGNKELYDKLKAAGASAKFVEITGSDFCDPAGNPSRQERATMTADFFDQNLK